MRACKRDNGKGQYAGAANLHTPVPEEHISGAETICSKRQIRRFIQGYVDRAITHPRGKPDSIVITIEELTKPLQPIAALPVITVPCGSLSRSETIIEMVLRKSGISAKAIRSALLILQSGETMRGASLVIASSGRRVEPDRLRGVRASRFVISRLSERTLSEQLKALGINTEPVKEALLLASKVASCRDVVAEVCISDDPDYTTGYVASSDIGYVRIPHIKKKRDRRGGRVFFLKEDADIQRVVQYLERTPVILQGKTPCLGEKTIDEILDRHHQ